MQTENEPSENVIQFQARHPLHRWWNESGNTSGSVFIDALTFWQITVPLWFSRVNWWMALTLAMLATSAIGFVVASYMLWQMLPPGALEHIYHLMGLAR